MPELPEVQTIVNDLNKKVKGYVIADFWSDWEKSIKMSFGDFKKGIEGRKIEKIERRGKNLLFFLSGSKVMLVHLKMTGHLLVKSNLSAGEQKSKFFEEKVNRYVHHVWHLKKKEKKLTMEFSDLRKFGKIRLLEKKNLNSDKELSGLGVEPLSSGFSFNVFNKILDKKAKSSVRNVLMDQSMISGIGNIYVSEILFEAGVRPDRNSSSLNKRDRELIFRAIKIILHKAIRLRGTSDSDYRDTDGAPGGFQKVLKVYNREGKPCRKKSCKGTISRKKINQRSAYWCESCQN